MGQDGSIIIGAEIEEKDFDKALDRMEKAASKSASNMEKEVSGLNDTLEDAAKKAEKIKIEPATSGVDEADSSLKKLGKTTEDVAKSIEGEVSGMNEVLKETADNAQKIHIEPTTDGIREIETDLVVLEQTAKKAAINMEKEVSVLSDTFEAAAANAEKIHIEPTTKGIREAERNLRELEKQFDALGAAADEAKSYMDFATEGGRYDNSMTRQIVKDYEDAAKAADETAQKIFGLEDAIAGAKQEMASAKQVTDDYKEGQQQLTKEQKESERQTRALEAAVQSFVTKVLAQAISKMSEVVENTLKFRQEMAMVETNLARMGQNMEQAVEYMGQFSAVSSDTSKNLEAVSNLLSSGFEGETLEEAINAVSGAVIQFPDQSVDRIAEGIQRSFGEGKAVSNFAELIKRAGGDVGAFDEAMARANTDAQKQAVILDELSRMGLTDTLNLYKEMNPEMVAASEAAYDLSDAQAALGEALQPIKSELDEYKAVIFEWAAGLIKAHPEATKAALAFAIVGTAILGVSAAAKTIGAVFGGIPSLFGSTAKGATETAKGLTQAGNAASGANMQFLSVAAGVAVMAAGIAVAVLALAELVKAFGGSGDDVMEVAGAVTITVGAMTAMLATMTALSRMTQNGGAQFVVYAAGVVLLSAAFAVMMEAMTGLVESFNESDQSAMQTALAITMMMGGMTVAISTIVLLSAAASKAMPVLAILAMMITSIAVALYAVAEAQKQINYGKMLDAGYIPSAYMPQGHAKGTLSASAGWKVVGEYGPELMRFGGGERVLNANRTMAMQGALGGGGQTVQVFNVGGISIPANTVRDFNQVITIMRNEAVSHQQGYAGGI